jgi:V/A-type H+-transporting ATPase subunit I
MIVPMKKVTLVCLETERENVLTNLRELGVMHMQPESHSVTPELLGIMDNWCAIQRGINFLSNIKLPQSYSTGALAISGHDMHREVLALIDEQHNLNKHLSSLQHDIAVVEPWGQFSIGTMHALENDGVFVYPCFSAVSMMNELKQRYNCVCEVIAGDKHNAHFILISDHALDCAALPLVTFPELSDLSKLRENELECQSRLNTVDARIMRMVSNKHILEQYFAETTEAVEFLTTRDNMSSHDKLAYISGFIPARDEQKLRDAADRYGWGLLINKPAATDPVPTLIELSPKFRMIQPLFKFLGLTTGYNEVEVSVCFLIFFSLFFGIIFTDAGYGVLFLIIGLFLKFKFRQEQFRLPINLFLFLSTVTIVWGALCGSWCGIEYGGIEWLSEPHNPELKNKHTELVCFIIAAIHLSVGHGLQMLKKPTIKNVLGHLGWVFVLWGNFLLATILIIYPEIPFPTAMFYLYGVGFPLILAFFIHWHEPAEVFSFPLETLSSFVDTLSYIRLFAVSVAGYYIAVNFNEMGINLIKTSPWLILLAVPTIVAGHLLNIVLALLGVLVHGVRLNTLEFSSHAAVKWSGLQFKPFKKNLPKQETIT